MPTAVLERSSNNMSIATLYENYKLGKFNLDPDYQRKSIWSEEKKSFLINSVFRNFPIPPIFLRQHINDDNGTTTYDVIDGKQRILSIIEFIEDKIIVSSEDDDGGNVFEGLYFSEFTDCEELLEHKKSFWKYLISIEYIDTLDDQLIDSVFDRLNRNGEPLTGQELRNAQYHGSTLSNLVIKLSKNQFWQERLKHVDLSRMEDIEFISELVCFIINKAPQTSNQNILDEFYKSYSNSKDVAWEEVEKTFELLTNFLVELNIDYDEYKVKGVSHLYAFWGLAHNATDQGVPASNVSTRLKDFFEELRSGNIITGQVSDYKLSMSSRTKDVSMRKKRIDSISSYCLK